VRAQPNRFDCLSRSARYCRCGCIVDPLKFCGVDADCSARLRSEGHNGSGGEGFTNWEHPEVLKAIFCGGIILVPLFGAEFSSRSIFRWGDLVLLGALIEPVCAVWHFFVLGVFCPLYYF